MKYILEDQKEFRRLESQSLTPLYDFKLELKDVLLRSPGRYLDAGCGSGIVSRYLAEKYPQAQVIGCDQSEDRVLKAANAAHGLKNLEFQRQDLTKLKFAPNSFDFIMSRFVLEHLDPKNCQRAVKEMVKCLRPGGKICLIDIDGYFFNLYPQPKSVQLFLKRLEGFGGVDMNIGRKLPSYLAKAGCSDIQWKIEMMQISGSNLEKEIELIKERFENSLDALTAIVGTKAKALRFQNDFLSCMQKPETVLFYNKFIVTAQKPHLKLLAKS